MNLYCSIKLHADIRPWCINRICGSQTLAQRPRRPRKNGARGRGHTRARPRAHAVRAQKAQPPRGNGEELLDVAMRLRGRIAAWPVKRGAPPREVGMAVVVLHTIAQYSRHVNCSVKVRQNSACTHAVNA